MRATAKTINTNQTTTSPSLPTASISQQNYLLHHSHRITTSPVSLPFKASTTHNNSMSNTDLLSSSKPFPADPVTVSPLSANSTCLASSCLSHPNQISTSTPSETTSISPQNPVNRSSWQLSRWSRIRSIRSHRRHGLPAGVDKAQSTDPSMISSLSPASSSTSSAGDSKVSLAGDVKMSMEKINNPNGFAGAMNQGKQIYMVSDGTGWTAEHSVYATLVQLQHCHGNNGCHIDTHLFSGVYDMEHLLEIIRQAARDGALLLYTLADPTMAEAAKHACQQLGVRSADILRPTSQVIAEHLGMAHEVTPHVYPSSKGKLADDYARLIHEAVEFTLIHDDGAQADDLSQAHIVLVGVSRTGKTPLSIYLAQKGYKVANIPIVTGMDLPKSLFEIDQERIFGLTVSPTVLQQVRMQRAIELGFLGSAYSEMDHVRKELDHAHKIFGQNPSWPVIDVTGKAMEETAALIVRMYNDKKQKRLMPLISKRY